MADGGLSHPELERGARDVEVSRGSLEGAERVEGKTRSVHNKTLVYFIASDKFDRLRQRRSSAKLARLREAAFGEPPEARLIWRLDIRKNDIVGGFVDEAAAWWAVALPETSEGL
jgi:hypothetical protein